MTKKYLILKRPIQKAQKGLWTGETSSALQKYGLTNPNKGFDGINPALVNATMGTQQNALEQAVGPTYGMPDISLEKSDINNNNTSNGVSAGVAGLVDSGTELLTGVTDSMFNSAATKNSQKDGFGNEVFDNKDVNLATGKSVLNTGLKTGAKVLAATGNPLLAGGAAVVGAIVGGFTGRKKAKEEKAAYEKSVNKNTMIYGKAGDMNLSRSLLGQYGKSGMKLDKKNLGPIKIQKKKSSSLIMKKGGKLVTPGEVNVVVKGKLHKENNNLGNRDKGIPVVDASGVKEYEVEAGEIIFRQELTHTIEKYAAEYKETKDDKLLEDLGKILVKELKTNTQDNYGKFGVKVKEDAN